MAESMKGTFRNGIQLREMPITKTRKYENVFALKSLACRADSYFVFSSFRAFVMKIGLILHAIRDIQHSVVHRRRQSPRGGVKC